MFVKRSSPNYAQPWQTQLQRSAVGSAFVIDSGKRHILTNAHVVAHHITIHVRRPGHPKKWKASLLCEGRSCDLALMTVGASTWVFLSICLCNASEGAQLTSACLWISASICAEEDEFWEGIQAVKFLGVPELQQQITVTGYPIGGDSLSITQGIVSRVTMSPYTSGAAQLMNIQVCSCWSYPGPARHIHQASLHSSNDHITIACTDLVNAMTLKIASDFPDRRGHLLAPLPAAIPRCQDVQHRLSIIEVAHAQPAQALAQQLGTMPSSYVPFFLTHAHRRQEVFIIHPV